jgi:hypothetical protein
MNYQNRKSFFALILSCIIMLLATTCYFPRYNKSGSQAEIAWDVSGYYFYLPAIFIYHDLKQLSFQEKIVAQYHPSDEAFQGTEQPNGGRVLQYTYGTALMYSPFFFIAHILAAPLGYPADGFSFPYQLAIGIGSLLFSFLGLFFLRKVLLEFFSDSATAVTIFCIAIGSNYLEYGSIGAAMTHSYLFTLYALLLWCSIKFWKSPSNKFALLIGLLAGLATIIRPTEIISFIIPFLIGLKSWKEIFERIKFLFRKFLFVLLAVIPVLCFGILQLCYWKYVSGHWLVYSYQDQGFSWLSPHLADGLFSYQAGWLVYTPIMIFALIGFFFLHEIKKELFWFSILFTGLFIYICFAWDIWYYSGNFGIRAMVQCYAVMAIPFTAFTEWMLQRKWKLILFSSLMLLFTYYNLWLTHQAHYGGLLTSFGMKKAYFWKIFCVLKYQLRQNIFWIAQSNLKVSRKIHKPFSSMILKMILWQLIQMRLMESAHFIFLLLKLTVLTI